MGVVEAIATSSNRLNVVGLLINDSLAAHLISGGRNHSKRQTRQHILSSENTNFTTEIRPANSPAGYPVQVA